MSSQRSSSWRLATVDFSLVPAAQRVIEGALTVVPSETVTIVVDRERSELGEALADAVRERSAQSRLIILEDCGTRPHRALAYVIRESLESSQASVFLAADMPEERAMRQELVSMATRFGLRHAHMVGATRRSIASGFSVDLQRIASVARSVRSRIRGQSVIRAHSQHGTELTVRCSPQHQWTEHSGIIRPGKWEYLPAGEITTTPGEISGVFVCNASMSACADSRPIKLQETPVRLVIESGHVRKVVCADERQERTIRQWMLSSDQNERVGTVVLGTNVGIRDPAEEIICDQTLPGIHIGLGTTWSGQTGAGWDAQGQLLFAAGYLDVDLDGAPLVRSGRYLDLS